MLNPSNEKSKYWLEKVTENETVEDLNYVEDAEKTLHLKCRLKKLRIKTAGNKP
jgi:hypothetical protein